MLANHLRVALALLVLPAMVACSASAQDGSASSEAAVTEAPAAAPSSASLANFVAVSPGLYRGGHPDGAGLDYLKSVGVKRIVNLEVGDFIEAFPWDISNELSDAKARGLTEIRYPMSAFEPAVSDEFDRHIDEILAILKTATPDDGIYVHCKHGQDRTGLVMGLERVVGEGWQPKDAHDEMVRIGFHTLFLGLEEYFENKTHWSQ
jgi:tyrosine-protein phosphatase SIW14